jgi:hypothetical protein
MAGISGYDCANDWTNWRGPLQNGVSLEHYTGAGKLADAPRLDLRCPQPWHSGRL